MGRGEYTKEQVATARRKRNRSVVAVASATVFTAMSLLWLFSIDYTTVWFKLAGIVTLLFVAAFFVAVWIYSGAQLELEDHLAKSQRRRRYSR